MAARGLRCQGLTVQVRADPPCPLLIGRADRMQVEGQGVAFGAFEAAAMTAEVQPGDLLDPQAMHLDDGWLPTQAALKQARAAFAKHDNTVALAKARHAQMLARISITQAEAQKRLWRNEVPH